jgi:hypothetical protein
MVRTVQHPAAGGAPMKRRRQKLPDCDNLFLRFFAPWYKQDELARRGFSAKTKLVEYVIYNYRWLVLGGLVIFLASRHFEGVGTFTGWMATWLGTCGGTFVRDARSWLFNPVILAIVDTGRGGHAAWGILTWSRSSTTCIRG